jgi:hypothetical protein
MSYYSFWDKEAAHTFAAECYAKGASSVRMIALNSKQIRVRVVWGI